MNKRGRPPIPHKQLFMLAAWELVEHELRLRGARSVDAAARSAMLVGKDGRARRTITINDAEGKRVSVIMDAKKLRRWHDEFEQLVAAAPPESLMAQRVAGLRALHASPETQEAYRRGAEVKKGYEELRRAQEHGGKPITSEDLARLFPL